MYQKIRKGTIEINYYYKNYMDPKKNILKLNEYFEFV